MESQTGLHGLGGTGHARLENILTAFSRSVNVLIVEEDDLREKHGFFISRLALTAHMHVQKSDRSHFFKAFHTQADGHGNEGIISSGGTDRVEFILNALPALVKVTFYLVHGVLLGFFLGSLPGGICIFQELFLIFPVALLCVGRQNLIRLRYGKMEFPY